MYRLMIVDDEPAIVDGLEQYFRESDEFEFDLCKAYSANEALETVKKTKLDLLISDIRMPGRSGMQLVDDVLSYWPSCRIILLTGHSEFEYAHKAIRKQVDNYILKTEGIEAIQKAVSAILGKIEEEKRNLHRLEHAEFRLTAAEPLLKRELFEALLVGENAADVWQESRYEGLSLQINGKKPYLMITGKVDFWEERVTHTGKMEAYSAIQSLFVDHLPLPIKAESIVHDRSELVWFIQPSQEVGLFAGGNDETNWDSLLDYLKGMLEPVQTGCRNELGIPVSFVLSAGAIKGDEIGTQFEMMRVAFKKRAAIGQSMAIIDLRMPDVWFQEDTGKPSSTFPQSTEFNKKLMKLEKCLEAGDSEGTSEITLELLSGLRNDMASNYSLGLERYYRLHITYLTYLNGIHSNDKQVNEIRIASFPMLEAPQEWGIVEQRLTKLGESVCQWKRDQVERGEHLLVERIHRFVGENLGGDLSLARIAEVVYFNPSYLSRFYKQMTGRNLSDFINEAKAGEAVALLTGTQMKVNEIALKLGFESPSYFTSFFRKMIGTTPQEFREAKA